MHVSNSSECGDHCIPFALGDDRCKHTHDLCCEQCEELKLVLEEIEEAATSEIAHYEYMCVYIPQDWLKACECNLFRIISMIITGNMEAKNKIAGCVCARLINYNLMQKYFWLCHKM